MNIVKHNKKNYEVTWFESTTLNARGLPVVYTGCRISLLTAKKPSRVVKDIAVDTVAKNPSDRENKVIARTEAFKKAVKQIDDRSLRTALHAGVSIRRPYKVAA